MKDLIAVAIYTIALILAHIYDTRAMEYLHNQSIEWAVQNTSDSLMVHCEDRINKILEQCDLAIKD